MARRRVNGGFSMEESQRAHRGVMCPPSPDPTGRPRCVSTTSYGRGKIPYAEAHPTCRFHWHTTRPGHFDSGGLWYFLQLEGACGAVPENNLLGGASRTSRECPDPSAGPPELVSKHGFSGGTRVPLKSDFFLWSPGKVQIPGINLCRY